MLFSMTKLQKDFMKGRNMWSKEFYSASQIGVSRSFQDALKIQKITESTAYVQLNLAHHCPDAISF